MNKPQAEGRVNHIRTVERRRRSTLFSTTKIESFLLISMIELDHQRSAAKTSVNKMGLYICVV